MLTNKGSFYCTTNNISTPKIALLLVLLILIIYMILHIRPNSQARAGTRKNLPRDLLWEILL